MLTDLLSVLFKFKSDSSGGGYVLCFYLLSFFLFFLGPHLWYMEVPRLGSNWICSCRPTPQPQQCLRHIRDLSHSLWQLWILNPLSEARDQTCILMDTNHFLNPLSHSGTLNSAFLISFWVMLLLGRTLNIKDLEVIFLGIYLEKTII